MSWSKVLKGFSTNSGRLIDTGREFNSMILLTVLYTLFNKNNKLLYQNKFKPVISNTYLITRANSEIILIKKTVSEEK